MVELNELWSVVYLGVVLIVAAGLWCTAKRHGYSDGYDDGYIDGVNDAKGRK